MSEGQWIATLVGAVVSLCGTIAGLYAHNRYLSKELTENTERHSSEKDTLHDEWRKGIEKLHREQQKRLEQTIEREQAVLTETRRVLEAILDAKDSLPPTSGGAT